MSSNKTCMTCIYKGVLLSGDSSLVNVCRFRPPAITAMVLPVQGGMRVQDFTLWPSIRETDWCGSHVTEVVLS